MKKTDLSVTVIALIMVILAFTIACVAAPDETVPATETVTETIDDTTANETLTDWRLDAPVADISPEQTRTHESLQLLDEDTFSLKSQIMYIKMDLYRRGDDVKVVVLGGFPQSVIDGKFFPVDGIDTPAKKSYYRKATKQDVQDTIDLMDGFDTMVSDKFDGATLTQVEVMNFKYNGVDYGDMYCESFLCEDGDVLRTYFNEKGEMFGVFFDDSYGLYHISPVVADNAFDLAPGYEAVPEESRE
ncbi:MAG: hypothetical protein FWG45_03570 [Oscillospiraceae bacterium]|nr:hypothetical protein [Oscillospiraceae bacterium]